MIYTENIQRKFDKIFKAFEGYIQEQNYFDIVYSNKIGYLRILVNSPEEGAIVLKNPEQMMEYLCGDIISDVIYSPDNPRPSHNDLILTDYEEMESRRRLTLIFDTMEGDKDYYLDFMEHYIKEYQGITENP